MVKAGLVQQPPQSPIEEPRRECADAWERGLVREFPREPIRYSDGSRDARLVVVITFALLGLLVVSVFVAQTVAVLGDGQIWLLPALAALMTARWSFTGVRAEVRRPYEGHLTSSGALRLVSLSGIKEGSIQTLRRVSWRRDRESGPYFVIQWKHGKTQLKPSHLVEWILDVDPALEVRGYTTKRRQATRKRLGL